MKKSLLNILLLATLALGIYFFYGLPWKHDFLKDKINNDLESRYKDEFSLGILHHKNVNGNSYFTTATSQNTGISFHVEISPDGQVIEDAYSIEYWSAAGEAYIKPLFDANFHDYTFTGEISTIKEPISQKEDLNKNRDAAHWNVHLGLKYPLTPENEDQELEKVLSSLQLVKEEGFILQKLSLDYLGTVIDIPNIHQNTFDNIEDLKSNTNNN